LEQLLTLEQIETPAILKRLATASRQLAELKGVATTISNQAILINTLGLQEAKDSSAIENIVTTHDELFQHDVSGTTGTPASKEVRDYGQALWAGFQLVRDSGLLTNNHILKIQAVLEKNQAGFRKLPGTELKNSLGQTVHVPPPPQHVPDLMRELERFINDDSVFNADPLIKMALIHYQFESIHPFYDGNGRSGRIINVLYLVKQGLLGIPVLYLSRYVVQHKADYYRLLQAVRATGAWEEWVCYILTAVEQTACEGVRNILAIKALQQHMRERIRAQYRFYSRDLIDILLKHPYTKIDFLVRDLGVSRVTAASYLKALTQGGFLHQRKIGRFNYFINQPLCRILTGSS
jgi:Fic family protein